MNYISKLQSDLTEANARIAAMETELREFRAHLASEKFHGFDSEGQRKDWINVSDVDARILGTLAAGV